MCISAAPAAFSGTTLFLGVRPDPAYGTAHLLGYRNTVANLAEGPNAMLLHLPAATRVRREDFLSAGKSSDVLERMVEAVEPPPAPEPDDGMDWMAAMSAPPPAVVFDHDVYTVVLAGHPGAVLAALDRVPAAKRPRIDPALLDFYGRRFPGHTLALCCFDNAQAERAKPLFVRYVPTDPELLVLPALDSHTGGPPDLGARVPTDHWVLFGSEATAPDWGHEVNYGPTVPGSLREQLPDRVMGRRFTGTSLPNGDFALRHEDLLAGRLDRVHRRRPTAR